MQHTLLWEFTTAAGCKWQLEAKLARVKYRGSRCVSSDLCLLVLDISGDWNLELDCTVLDRCWEQHCFRGKSQWVCWYWKGGQCSHPTHWTTASDAKPNTFREEGLLCCLLTLRHYVIQASWSVEGSSLPLAWPQTGTIEFTDYGLQYRKGLELALKGITLHINKREKVTCDLV